MKLQSSHRMLRQVMHKTHHIQIIIFSLNESETVTKRTQNLTPVIEYENVSDQIKLTNQDIQGIVSLRFERGEINGETQREVLQRLNPTVVLDDLNKDK